MCVDIILSLVASCCYELAVQCAAICAQFSLAVVWFYVRELWRWTTRKYPKFSFGLFLAVIAIPAISCVNEPLKLGDDAPLLAIPDSFVENYTGSFSAGASLFPIGLPSFTTGATQSPSPLACAADSCNQSGSGSYECETMSGKYACVPSSARYDKTTTGQTCKGGQGWGQSCDFWGGRKQELYEKWFAGFMRYSWCYTTRPGFLFASWDYCVAEQPQIFPRWAAPEPCLAWTEVTSDPFAEFELQFLNVSERKYIRSRYRPDHREWYDAQVPEGNACALPAFGAFPSDWQLTNAQTTLQPSDYRDQVPMGIQVSSIPWLRRFLVDKNGDRFFGPYCFVQTVLGPRAAQCKAMCREKTCSGHGVCSVDWTAQPPSSQCTCNLGWSGEHCDIPVQGSVSCQAMLDMGLDDDGEFSLFSLVYIWRLVSMYQIALLTLAPVGWGQPTSGNVAIRITTKLFAVLGVAWLFGFTLVCIVGICQILHDDFEDDAPSNKATWWWSMLAFVVIFGLPFMIMLLLAPFVIFVLPILAWRKLWHLERALAFCIGPVGVNMFVIPAAALLPIIYFLVKASGIIGRVKSLSKTSTPLLSKGDKVRVCATGRVGEVTSSDTQDFFLPCKVRFCDGDGPEEDWFGRDGVERGTNTVEPPTQYSLYAAKDLALALYGVYSSWATYLSSISAKHGAGSILLIGHISCSTVLLSSAIVATAVFIGSLFLGWFLDGTKVLTDPWPLALTILKRSPTPLVHVVATTLLWTKILLVDVIHVLIGVASPFFSHRTFVPDFILYMSAYSAYSLYRDWRKAVVVRMHIAMDDAGQTGPNSTQVPFLSH